MKEKYQFDSEEMKLVRDALTVHSNMCFSYFKEAVTERKKQEVYELSIKLERLLERLEVRVLQD